MNYRLKTYPFSLNTLQYVDSFTMCRGTICGMVSVSIQPASLLSILALVNGLLAGIIYLLALKLTRPMKVDDPMHVSIVHGVGALWGLLSICFFHKDEGFFFKDIYSEYNRNDELKTIEEIDVEEVAYIILVLGSNSLAACLVAFLSCATTFIVLRSLFKPFPRISHIHEIFGQDVYGLYC